MKCKNASNKTPEKNKLQRLALNAAFSFLIIFSLNAFSLSIDSSDNVQQGDLLSFYGSCAPKETLSINALNGERKIFSANAECTPDGNYSFEFQSSFTDPSGNWIISVVSKEGSIKKKIFIARKKEAALFLVSFLSPSTSDVSRAETLELSVKITDVKTPVNDANVFFFGLNGEKNKMDFIGEGIYSASYDIPFNSELKEWELMVLCEKESGSGKEGGSGIMDVKIVPASILVEFIQPSLNSFDLSSKIQIKVEARYATGNNLVNPLIELKANSRVFPLKEESPGIYFMDFIPSINDKGSLLLEITALDSAGNTGHAEKLIQTTGEEGFLLRENIFLIIVLAALIIGLTLFSAKKMFVVLEKPALMKQKMQTLEKIRELQKSYFSEGTLNANDYKNSLAELNSKLSQLDEKINRLEPEMKKTNPEKKAILPNKASPNEANDKN